MSRKAAMQPVRVPSTSSRPQGLQEKELVVLAKCVIKVGYFCTVYFPTHDDPESYREHCLYHEQNAKVVRIRQRGGLDLEMTTGEATGEIVKDIDPTNIFFWGPFTSTTGKG